MTHFTCQMEQMTIHTRLWTNYSAEKTKFIDKIIEMQIFENDKKTFHVYWDSDIAFHPLNVSYVP